MRAQWPKSIASKEDSRHWTKPCKPQQYKRGETLQLKEAVKLRSLGVLLSAGNALEMPEELTREAMKMPAVEMPAPAAKTIPEGAV